MPTYLNRGGRELMGLDQDADVTTLPARGFHRSDSGDKVTNAGVPEATRTGRWSGRSILVNRDGREIPVSQVLVAHRNADGEVEYFATIMRDISEQLTLERRVNAAEKVESLGLMAGGVAHDFNNLLVGVLCNASLLVDDLPERSENRALALDIQRAAERAAELSRQMLAYAGKARVELVDVDVSSLAARSLPLLQASIPAHAQIVSKLQRPLPILRGDPTQLEQVLSNLVINAAESLGEEAGEVEIRTEHLEHPFGELLRDDLPEGLQHGVVCLSVRDTGAGMTEDTRRRAFDPFFTTKFTGRGLGLSSVMGIVRAHQGAIAVESRVGVGTVFRLFFPAAEPTASHRPPVSTSNEHVTRRRVLLVDDEDVVLRVAEVVIRRMGLEPVCANSGARALELVQRDPARIHAAVVDLNMPGMDGIQLARALKGLNPSIPVLLSSGYPESRVDEVDEVDGFLPKPYTPSQMTQALQALLDDAIVAPPD